MVNVLKRIGNRREWLVLDKYTRLGYHAYRVPMSNLPFDIIAINPETREILFIEVKGRGGRLTERQRRFKEMIDKYSEWKVRYIVEEVD